MNATLPTRPTVPERVGTRTLLKLYMTAGGEWRVHWQCDCKATGNTGVDQWPRSTTCGRCSKPHKWRLQQGSVRPQKLSKAARSEHFRCMRLGCAITRGACAARHQQFNGRAYRTEGATGCACSGCEIGKQHRAGVAADVQLVQVTARPSGKPIKRRKCMACGARLPGYRTSTCSQACANEKSEHTAIARAIEMNVRLG